MPTNKQYHLRAAAAHILMALTDQKAFNIVHSDCKMVENWITMHVDRDGLQEKLEVTK